MTNGALGVLLEGVAPELLRPPANACGSRCTRTGWPRDPAPPAAGAGAGVVVPLRLRPAGGAELTFLSTTSRFGTALDVTLAGLWIEAFYPADEATAAALRA
jgi:hypothetical protein